MPRPVGTLLLLVVATAAALAVVGIGTAHGADLSPQQQSELVAYAKSECAAAGGTFFERLSTFGCEIKDGDTKVGVYCTKRDGECVTDEEVGKVRAPAAQGAAVRGKIQALRGKLTARVARVRTR